MKANRRMETKTPSRAVLRLRGRLNLRCAVDSARGGQEAMVTPVSTYYYLGGVMRSPLVDHPRDNSKGRH